MSVKGVGPDPRRQYVWSPWADGCWHLHTEAGQPPGAKQKHRYLRCWPGCTASLHMQRPESSRWKHSSPGACQANGTSTDGSGRNSWPSARPADIAHAWFGKHTGFQAFDDLRTDEIMAFASDLVIKNNISARIDYTREFCILPRSAEWPAPREVASHHTHQPQKQESVVSCCLLIRRRGGTLKHIPLPYKT